jgi:hypothetical protein
LEIIKTSLEYSERSPKFLLFLVMEGSKMGDILGEEIVGNRENDFFDF